MLPIPKQTPAPEIKRISVRQWDKGTVTALDNGRTPLEGLRLSSNLILEQDATIRPRPSLVKYGPQPVGRVLGQIFEFRRLNNGIPENWMASVQEVSGTAKAYVARGEDSSWTECAGSTYDSSAPCRFLQVQDKVLIMNGVDSLSFINTATLAITKYTQLSNPSAPTLDTNTGLTGTAFKVYYAITANSTVGETAGSAILTQQILKDRDLWNPTTESIKIAWTTVAGVKSWNVYMGVAADGAGDPKLYAIATGLEPTTLSFTDNGTRAQDLTKPLPEYNTTAGPKAKRGDVSNGRPWLVGDPDNPYYVWRGGDYGYELDFSPSNGGGYTPVGHGTKNIPTAVRSFRDGKGDAKVMVLSQGTNGSGRRSYLSPVNMNVGNAPLVVWQVTEDSGQDGTDSPDGVIIYQNSAYYPSRDGFKTTATKPQLQNILSTDRISNTIQGDIATLNTSAADLSVGLAYEGRLYWSVAVSSEKNNQIWVLDLDRKGAWMKPWHVSADWLTLYNDNSGRTHFLALVNNEIMEFTYAARSMDGDHPFITSGQSGQVKFSEDGREWGRLIQLIFVLLRPQGSLDFTVSGKTEDGLLPFSKAVEFAANASRAGWSEPMAGWSSLRGWSEIVAVPESFNSPTEEVIVEIDEDMQWFEYGFGSTQAGVDYSVSDVIAEYVPVGIKDLT